MNMLYHNLGHLNTRVLDILRSLDIQRLSLTTSLFDENGLNIYCDDFFPGIYYRAYKHPLA